MLSYKSDLSLENFMHYDKAFSERHSVNQEKYLKIKYVYKCIIGQGCFDLVLQNGAKSPVTGVMWCTTSLNSADSAIYCDCNKPSPLIRRKTIGKPRCLSNANEPIGKKSKVDYALLFVICNPPLYNPEPGNVVGLN